MKNIIALAGSNSKQSINKELAHYVANQLEEVAVTTIDLNDFEMPLFGIDLETEKGIPENATKLLEILQGADGLVLSLAEHNGAYSAVFKNSFDWMSRIDGKVFGGVPMLLLATSPGARGGASVLEIAKARFPYNGGNVVADFSLPSFSQNFSSEGITDMELRKDLDVAIDTFKNAVETFEK
ncbi:NADPH-dependent FMN reductase [Ulvibacter litoralis]|uniref:NAD(P)H-dependent FMN reductase n=1 Tax=Ulvibacter litoralis TaxID=227084 RepID=A0A1G7I4B8_9FLAO|nr:NAD(P)H-dependent oxidoreductase [Ulvibacter litoralis]GHC62563.1 FMN reductase [Ulvibacter litoralis]SDF07463.1 NAD(P)H-dependent FMN reductase [Ulvibacter litoralis]